MRMPSFQEFFSSFQDNEWLSKAWRGAWYALAQVTIVSIFGIAPLAFTALQTENLLGSNDNKLNFWELIWAALDDGQLFFYAFSLVGTLIWLSIGDWKSDYGPFRILFTLVFMLFAFLLAASGIFNPRFEASQSEFAVGMSFTIYFLFLFLYFLLIARTQFPAINLSSLFTKSGDRLASKARELQDE